MAQTVTVMRGLEPRSIPLVTLLLPVLLFFGLGCGDLIPKRTAGEKLYRKHCADCHGLRGDGHTLRFMGNPKADLTDSFWKYGGGDSLAIQETVRQGLVERHPASLQRLDREQVKEIADWVLKLRGEVDY